MPVPKPTVFINCAHEDKKAAKKLYADLEKNGAEPWLDEESLLPGQKWRVAIRQAIRNSRYFLAVLSSNSISRRGYVHKEMAEALEMLDQFPESDIFIIPVRLDDCSPSHDRLRDLQWVDLFPSWEEGLARILRAVGLQEKARAEAAAPGEPGKGVALPAIWNLPHHRNPNFTGRGDLLDALRTALTSTAWSRPSPATACPTTPAPPGPPPPCKS
jgi:hypothetical protein